MRHAFLRPNVSRPVHSVYIRFVVRPILDSIEASKSVSRKKRTSAVNYFFPVDQSPTMVLTYNIKTYIFISIYVCTDCCITGTLKRTFLFNIKPKRADDETRYLFWRDATSTESIEIFSTCCIRRFVFPIFTCTFPYFLKRSWSWF